MKSLTIFIAMSALLSAASCDKMPENGKLDGMWQIMSVNYAHNSAYDSLVSLRPQKVYMSFQLKLVQIRTGGLSGITKMSYILSRFKRSGSSLLLYDFYAQRFADDVLLTDSATTVLHCIGIDGLSADFHIDRLDDDQMQLSSSYARLVCRKI